MTRSKIYTNAVLAATTLSTLAFVVGAPSKWY